MKKGVNLLLIFVIVVAAAGIVLLALFWNHVDFDDMTEMKISRVGTMMPCGDEYTLTYQNGIWDATYTRIEWSEEYEQTVSVYGDFADQVKKILDDNNVQKWDCFDRKNPLVTDGENFTFSVRFSDGTTIEACGYMAYPKNFHTVWGAIEDLYAPLFE